MQDHSLPKNEATSYTTEECVNTGIPSDQTALALKPPDTRTHTDFVVA
ncbi:MAG TPA: hypothetical protein VI542_23555 [Candidatus Tectomicrobia bacterium]